MIKIFVDSGSSIKQEEKEKLNVEILPLKLLIGDTEYLDGVDITMDTFYDLLMNKGLFPKTSLPSLEDTKETVEKYTNDGYDVAILTISSGISGTYNALKMTFNDNPKVRVIDSKSAVGGMRILALEANKYLDGTLDQLEEKLSDIIPRLMAIAVPETLEYLYKGGRLNKAGLLLGSVLKIKPIICLADTVKPAGKVIGLKAAMRNIISSLEDCDTNYPIVPSYTYDDTNLNELIEKTDDKYKAIMIEKDNLDAALACHWGPNAFGYIYVKKK